MYKIHVCRGEFCNILRFSLLQALLVVLFNSLPALLVVLFNSLQALLAVIPSRFEYNLAITTGPSSKQLPQFLSRVVFACYSQNVLTHYRQVVLTYYSQDLKFTCVELT